MKMTFLQTDVDYTQKSNKSIQKIVILKGVTCSKPSFWVPIATFQGCNDGGDVFLNTTSGAWDGKGRSAWLCPYPLLGAISQKAAEEVAGP